jgi:hypothetical protein
MFQKNADNYLFSLRAPRDLPRKDLWILRLPFGYGCATIESNRERGEFHECKRKTADEH